jgi:Flp pilus assembly protein TadG
VTGRLAVRERVRRLRSTGDRGFLTLEIVIVIPVALTLTLLVVQYVMLWHARHVAEAAAQNGLRVARGYLSSAAAGQSSATEYLNATAGHLLSCDAQCVHATRDLVTATVTVHATVKSVVPFGHFSVTEHATGPVERFTP